MKQVRGRQTNLRGHTVGAGHPMSRWPEELVERARAMRRNCATDSRVALAGSTVEGWTCGRRMPAPVQVKATTDAHRWGRLAIQTEQQSAGPDRKKVDQAAHVGNPEGAATPEQGSDPTNESRPTNRPGTPPGLDNRENHTMHRLPELTLMPAERRYGRALVRETTQRLASRSLLLRRPPEWAGLEVVSQKDKTFIAESGNR